MDGGKLLGLIVLAFLALRFMSRRSSAAFLAANPGVNAPPQPYWQPDVAFQLQAGVPTPAADASAWRVGGTTFFKPTQASPVYVNPDLPEYQGGFRIVGGRPVGV